MKKPSWTAETFLDPGVTLFIDKPIEWTSYQVVRKMRALFNVKKAGHAGTLDPKATGLLIVCTGKKTREIESFMSQQKEYEGTIELGIRTPSFDLETEVIERRSVDGIQEEDIRAQLHAMSGERPQQPPMYSALKRAGTPLYKLARRGVEVEREARMITITRFEMLKWEMPFVTFSVACSKGTYIRSLADELGQKLGCGGTLTSLRRTKIGEHTVQDAFTIDELMVLSRELGIVRRSRHADHPAN